METAELHTGENIEYYPEKLLGQGVEKEFYASSDPDLVVGFFRDQEGSNDAERMKRLSHIIDKYNPGLDPEKKTYWEDYFCWPIAVVVKPKTGILCPKFPDKYYFKDIQSEKKGKWFSNQRLSQKTVEGSQLDLLTRLKICRHLAKAVGRLHLAGLCHSDLSGNNILMDPDTGTCMLIDIDSLVVPSILPAKVLGTKGYCAPEVVATTQLSLTHPKKNLPNIKTDLHALAVIIYETLLMRHPLIGKKVHSQDPDLDDFLLFGENALFIENPRDLSNRPDNLHMQMEFLGPHLSKMFELAFVDGLDDMGKRPTAMEWEKALTITMDMLYPCSGEYCNYKWFVFRSSTARCPECGTKVQESIPVMHLFEKFKNGQYISTNSYLTLYNNKKIFKYHARSGVSYPEDVDIESSSLGHFTYRSGSWFIETDNRKKIFPNINSSRKDPVELFDRQVILLDESSNGRLGMLNFN